ncbi:MAG: PAS domain S-box protein [Burkholderiales bacterium]
MFDKFRLTVPTTSLLMVLFGLLLIVALWGVTLSQVRHEYAEASAGEFRKNGNLALAHEQQVVRLLREADQILLLVKEQYENAGPKTDLKRLVATGIIDQQVFTFFNVTNERGDVIAAGRDIMPLNLADQEYFQYHQGNDLNALRIGVPILLGRATGRSGIPLTRRFNKPDGSFGGVVNIAINPQFLTGMFQTADLGASDTLALIRDDGIILARRTGEERSYGQNVSHSRLMVEQRKNRVGSYLDESAVDRKLKFFSYRRLKDYPLIVLVATLEAEVLAPLQRRAMRSYVNAAIASAFIVAFCAVLIMLLLRQRRGVVALRESEESLSATLQSIGDAVIATDIQGRITRMNPAAGQLTGWGTVDAVGQLLNDVFHIVNAQTREPLDSPVQRVLVQRGVVGLANHITLLSRDGKEYQISENAAPIRDATGRITGVVLVFSDVTEHYRLRHAATEGENRLRKLIDGLGPSIFLGLMTPDGILIEANRPAWAAARLKTEDMLGKLFEDTCCWTYSPVVQQQIRDAIKRAAQGERSHFEVKIRLAKNRFAIVDFFLNFLRDDDGKIVFLVPSAIDITARKQAEETQARLAAIVEDSNEAIDSRTFEGTILTWNAGAERMLGYTAEEVIGKSTDLIRSIGRMSMRARNNEHVLRGERNAFEADRLTRDGRVINVIVSYSPMRSPTGEIIGVSLILQDITALTQARAAAEESEALFRAAFEGAGVGVAIRAIDPNAPRLLRVNQKFMDILGYTREELLQLTTLDITAIEDKAETVDHNERLARGDLTTYIREKRYRRKDGSIVWVNLSIGGVQGTDGRMKQAVVVIQDISERKRAEAESKALEGQLRESQKMEAIGTLAGGIAHDFNNIVGVILGNAELARQDAHDNPGVLESLEEIRKAGYRARDLVQQILSFSRNQTTEFVTLSLLEVVGDAIGLLRTTLLRNVNVDVQYAADVPLVLADPTQIQQVMLNLVTNAAQAVRRLQGHIRIQVECVTLDEFAASGLPDLQAGRYARIEVIDNGPGMDAATIARIYEPFFTTKPRGEGTGLGLSVVHGIVQTHRGAISVHSTPGKGAAFAVYLPAVDSALAPERIEERETAAVKGHSLHILYVDDDDALLLLVSRMLSRSGYRVSGYISQEKALAALSADPEGFDLVLTDYNMPGMSGLDVARAVRNIRANLPVVIASGYITDALRAQAAEAGVRDMIFKANAVEEFCNVIQRIDMTPVS